MKTYEKNIHQNLKNRLKGTVLYEAVIGKMVEQATQVGAIKWMPTLTAMHTTWDISVPITGIEREWVM